MHIPVRERNLEYFHKLHGYVRSPMYGKLDHWLVDDGVTSLLRSLFPTTSHQKTRHHLKMSFLPVLISQVINKSVNI